MQIIGEDRLMKLARKHGDCFKQVQVWCNIVRQVAWRNLVEVRQTFPTADPVDDKTVFNIKGNAYRLITTVWYEGGTIYIKDLLTHDAYNKGTWKSK